MGGRLELGKSSSKLYRRFSKHFDQPWFALASSNSNSISSSNRNSIGNSISSSNNRSNSNINNKSTWG